MGRPEEEMQDQQGDEQQHQPYGQEYYNHQENPNVEFTPPPTYPPPPPPAQYQNEPQYQMPQPPQFQPFNQNPPQPPQFQAFNQNQPGYPPPQKPSSQQYAGYNQNPAQMGQSPRPAVGYPQMQVNVGTENWNSELFGCLEDPQNALITAFFPCVTFGQIAEIVDNGHSSCTTQGALYGAALVCLGMPCLVSCSYRTKLRSRYELMETPAPDWFTHCFCEPCALCQEYRELRHRGFDPSIGWQGNLALQERNYPMKPPASPGMMHR